MSLREAWDRQREEAAHTLGAVASRVESEWNDRRSGETKPKVVICRGCCCGTTSKHPDFDHDEQVEAVSAVARTRIVDCLDQCAHSNVMIVRSSLGRSTWIGGLTTEAATSTLCDWLRDGARQPMPTELQERTISLRSRMLGQS